jgi:diaminopimelate epimerase
MVVEMTAVRVTKLHATGNDFLVVSGMAALEVEVSTAEIAARLCDRHTGIGADGLIVLEPGVDDADASMVLHNADGGIAEMSGNGIRCLAWEAVRRGIGEGGRLVVDTAGGRRSIDYDTDADGLVTSAIVDMGPVTFDPAAIPLAAPSPFGLTAEFHGTQYEGDAAGMGNPHLVLFVDDPAAARVTQHGPHLEHDARFPKRTNVEFIRVTDGDEVTMRVWERGVGETLSCGTGACASAAVAHRRGLVSDRVTVHVPGGDLSVELGAGPKGSVRLGGPVVHVFDVTIDLERFLATAVGSARA